jgi:hypothetical protein
MFNVPNHQGKYFRRMFSVPNAGKSSSAVGFKVGIGTGTRFVTGTGLDLRRWIMVGVVFWMVLCGTRRWFGTRFVTGTGLDLRRWNMVVGVTGTGLD